MLKFLLGLLAVINFALLASNAGILGAGNSDGHEPRRMANQLNAQRIVLVDPVLTGSAATRPAATGGASASASGATESAALPGVPAPALAVSTTAAAAGPALACIEIGNFDAAEAIRFEPLATSLAPGNQLSRRSVQEVERYIVYIPPLADKESADRKGAELRRLGVDDFFVFNDNSDLRFGISLGIFKSAEAAAQHLATLGRKGVRSAKIAARLGAASKTAFQLRGLDPQGQAALTRIQASFPRQETRSCAAP